MTGEISEIEPPEPGPDAKRKVPRTIIHDLRRIFLSPELSEAETYKKINASYGEYDRTFGIDSVGEMRAWYQQHPGERGAVLEIAGYGVAPSDLIGELLRTGICTRDKAPYGLALAREPYWRIKTPFAECIGGDMGDLARPDGIATGSIRQRLEANGSPGGAALIYMRPIGGYLQLEDEHGIRPEERDEVYLGVLAGVSRFLAPHGTFVVEIPPHIRDRNVFVQQLHERLGVGFTVSHPRLAPLQAASILGWRRFRTLTIRRAE